MCTARMSPHASLRLRVARGLEEGAWDGPLGRALSRAWGAIGSRTLARPLVWPDGVRTIAIGGATLGGSGKTPLAIACARALADAGLEVALVSHGYGARPGSPRVVRVDDDVALVGDEALVAARALEGKARVLVGPTRQAALDLAVGEGAGSARVLVLDGVLQTAPRRASLSLLAQDGRSPWGAGDVVPRGDLRASPRALLAACDHAVLVDERPLPGPMVAIVRSRGARSPAGPFLDWPALAGLRVGLFVALARPGRLVTSLAGHGVFPARVVRVPDHGLPAAHLRARLAGPPVDLWLATPKCGVHLAQAAIPHAVLDHELRLGEDLIQALVRAAR